ncbi:MAG: autotransporter outer membrane beta-barrel domain-containing protein [Caulobacteraceae bacterium]
MRKSLLTAAAMAPLLLGAAAAQAATTITGERTTPVTTATANNGQPDDVVIAAGAKLKLTSGVAVTVNSDNLFTNNGVIGFEGAADNSVGVLVLTPHTGSITSTGEITLTDGYTATDINDDGIPDGAFATGTGRYGIRVMGPGLFTGGLSSTGIISVEGNGSFGISIESGMVGDVTLDGTITMLGDGSVGFSETGGIDGKITIDSSILVTGKDAVALDLGGDVTGSLRLYSSIISTGYRITERIGDPEIVANLQDLNVQQAGSAVQVRGDVQGGILIGKPPVVTTPPDADDDLDGDGVPDLNEGTGFIKQYGSAPALLIGETGDDIQIGAFGTGDNAYGLIVRGEIGADGVYDGKSANAITLGAEGGTVHVEGGAWIFGKVSATAYKADATGIHMMSGATMDSLKVDGTLFASVFSDEDATARALVIDQGGGLTQIVNTGNISASFTGDLGSAIAIEDKAGGLTSIINSGSITANTVSADGTTVPTGAAIALDLSANTSGVSIVQNANANSTETVPILSYIRGDVLLGSGNDSVDINSGSIVGALDFAEGSGTFSIDGGAIYKGALTATGPLAIDVAKGVLDNRSTTTLTATSLAVGSESSLLFGIDAAAGEASRIDVAGTADIAAGGKIGVTISSLPAGAQTFTLLTAEALNFDGDASTLLGATPYLLVAGLDVDEAAGQIDVNIRRRSAAEADFNAAQTAAYDAVYDELPVDSSILGAFLAQTSRDGLVGLYDQMLPDHAGGVLRALSWTQEASSKGAADWPRATDPVSGPTRAWTQEIGLGEQKSQGDAAAWNIYGFGAVGGLESVSADGSALGMLVNFSTANVTNPDTAGDDMIGVSQIGAGVYWRGAFGNLHADAQTGAGFVWVRGRREFIASTGAGVVHREAEADWTGYSVYGRAGLAYDWTSGRLAITPAVHLDYFRLFEGGYTETGGGDGFDLVVDSRTSDILTLTPTLTFGYTWGDKVKYRPEIEIGWRQVLAGSAGTTSGHFHNGTTLFDLLGEDINGGAPIVRVGFRVFSGWLDVKIDAGGEFRDEYTDLDLRLTARMIF